MHAADAFVAALRADLGPDRVVTDPEVAATHAVDWTGRFHGVPPAVVRPRTVDEVAAVVATAIEHGIALVPQGGNTGLVGGATPCDGEVVVDLRALAAVTDVDPVGGQLTAGAGTTVADVQAAARGAGWAYGVDWAARDSATVGGSVATDAGGLRFVRHGSTRRQLLGVEAVLGTGATIRHLPAVEKDNTGYDLAALLCGSEGTLGLVTAARLRLVPPAGPLATALVGFASTAAAVEAASVLRRSLAGLEAVELVLADGVALVRSVTGLPAPLAAEAPVLLLVEAGDHVDPERRLAEAVAGLDGVLDAAVAVDGPRRAQLWRYREEHTSAISTVGPPHKFDVTLPAAALAAFIDDVPDVVAAVAPSARTWCFGHAADGNVHVNVTGLAPDDEAVADVVLQRVADLGGSISAEHGIGRAKRRWLHLARTPSEVGAMRAIKAALDPHGLCNPAVLLPPP
ncbi:FAD-binding oxidoreductase [Aquihabitans sp. G128]|uniref:FAD-binding oxidoreductase n=1 Tax=Aquihabitans sp. G128 TaxID=2849779 RepID=UPI001C24A6E5|nr:FAD-binding oxidoreductase [Aquihabitans sp. G128]QXC62083.1 FAD-binding oxidoreductase [Aquihabitans sp. G128]